MINTKSDWVKKIRGSKEFHAVKNNMSLCGLKPGLMRWVSGKRLQSVTCDECLKKWFK